MSEALMWGRKEWGCVGRPFLFLMGWGLGCIGLYWVVSDCIGLYWVVLGCIGT